MPTDNRNSFDPAEGARLADQLCSRDLPTLDFDALDRWLRAAAEHCTHFAHQRAELTTLRDDYQARIGGMLKAIAVADQSRKRQDALAEIITSLATMPVDELLACYRRTCAIFRDCFPNTLPPGISRT